MQEKIEELEKTASESLPTDLTPKKNRKLRRYEAKLLRQQSKQYRDHYYWHRRFINEMKQNSIIQQKVVNGIFDYFLEVPEKAEGSPES